MCKAEAGGGSGGGTGHAVVTEAEASRTDLETPVVWLLMGIREEMVMRGLPGKRAQGQDRDLQYTTLGHGPPPSGEQTVGNAYASQFSPEAGTFRFTKDGQVPGLLVGEQDGTFQMF